EGSPPTPSQYAELVATVRRDRLAATAREMDWVVVRNRMAPLASRNHRKVSNRLKQLAVRLDFRVSDGVMERVVFRELFPLGLTAFGRLDREVLGVRPTISQLAARREIRDLIRNLGLPGVSSPTPPSGEEALPPAAVSAK